MVLPWKKNKTKRNWRSECVVVSQWLRVIDASAFAFVEKGLFHFILKCLICMNWNGGSL